jgi:hypothetical protein
MGLLIFLHFCTCLLHVPSHLYFKLLVSWLLDKNFTPLEATRTIWLKRKSLKWEPHKLCLYLGLDVIYGNITCKIKRLLFQR